MARLEVYFTNGRSARLDPDKVCFTSEPYRRVDAVGDTTSSAELLAAGGAIINWDAVSFIRLEKEEDEEP